MPQNHQRIVETHGSSPPRAQRGSGDPLIVLLVVPDADMRLYMRGCLRFAPRVGRVIEASDGIEALTLARAGAVDFVITDSALPRLDGPGLHAAIRNDPELSHIPVLVIGDAPDAAPDDAYLPKPFNTRQLRDAVERSHRPSRSAPHA